MTERRRAVYAACDCRGRARIEGEQAPVGRPIGQGLGRRRESVGLSPGWRGAQA